MRERIEGYIDAKQVNTAVRITMASGHRDPRSSFGEKNVDSGPEQLIGSARAGIPGASPRIVGICRIVLASGLLTRGIATDPSDATGSWLIFDQLNIVTAGFTAADEQEVAVLIGGVEIGDLRHRSKQSVA